MRSGVNWMRLNVPPRTSARVLIVSVLARPGNALEEEVAAGQQADEDALEHRVLADDDPPDLEQDRLRRGARIGRIGEGVQVGGGRRNVAGRVGHVGLRSGRSGRGRWARPGGDSDVRGVF